MKIAIMKLEFYINKKTDIYAFDNMIQIDDDNFMINNKILNIAKWETKEWNNDIYWGTYIKCGFTTKD